MREVLSHSLGPFPLSLANGLGMMHKTQKSKLMHVIESKAENHIAGTTPDGNNALIIDGMALIQSSLKLPSTFGEYALQLLQKIVNLAAYHKSTRADFVIDRYPIISIKDLERSKRAHEGVTIVNIYSHDQKLPAQWGKFLKYGPNKEALIEFLLEFWASTKSAFFHKVNLLVCHQEKCHILKPMINENEPVIMEEVTELFCDHEEADTRLILHALHASQLHLNVIIRSPDTDVFIILLSASSHVDSRLLFETGVKEKARIIDITCLASQLGDNQCKALIGFHAFTGKFVC